MHILPNLQDGEYVAITEQTVYGTTFIKIYKVSMSKEATVAAFTLVDVVDTFEEAKEIIKELEDGT